jgi:guanylate kinase
LIFVISGPGGVGKGTIVKRLLELDPELRLSRSWTTRPRRPGESEDAYVFVDEPTFQERIDTGGFLEWTRFPASGALMGTPAFDPTAAGETLLEIDLDGAQQVKKRDPNAVLIFIVAPSVQDQEARLRRRGDDEESIIRRLSLGAQETELGTRIADHVVVNDDVDRAAAEVAGIIARCRSAS